jgi:hypothetical protein
MENVCRKKITDVTPLFRAFKKHLKTHRDRVARLQLVGRLEDYLTKELAYVILIQSQGAVLPVGNLGTAKDNRRIDLVLVKGNLSKAFDRETAREAKAKNYVHALFEMKYIRNRSRTGFANTCDETIPIMNSLCQQLECPVLDEYAGYNVKLRSLKGSIYGMVFASFVCRDDEGSRMKKEEAKFIKANITRAKQRMRSHNNKCPTLNPIYSRYPVKALNAKFRVSLYVGLWRIRELNKVS